MSYSLSQAIAGAEAARSYMRDLGLRRRGWHDAVVVDRALARGLAVTADERGRARLSDGRRSWWFSGCNTNFNAPLAVRCTRRKEVTNALLRSHGLNAPRNAVFQADASGRAWAWSESALPVVLKPSSNTLGGKHVYVGVSDPEEFREIFTLIGERYGRVLVEELADGVEHRVLTIGKEVFGVVQRVPAHVVGDGASTIRALAERKSAERVAEGNPLHGEVKMDAVVMRELGKQGLSAESVPPAGQTVFLRSTSNTHFGGDAVDKTAELTPGEAAFVQRAARTFTGLNLAGFDVLLPRDGQGTEPCIIEINANPAIGLHHFPIRGKVRDAAGRLLDLMFPMTRVETPHLLADTATAGSTWRLS